MDAALRDRGMKLARAFDELERATRERDLGAATIALQVIFGLRVAVTDVPPTDDPPRVAMLRYDEPRRIDLAALRRCARPVAKFEDLSLARASALCRTLESEGFATVRVGPYSKRFDVSVADDASSGALHTVIAGQGALPAAIAEAERDRSSSGTRRAGELLGYPSCCIERFVDVSQSEQADAEGVNEATLRAFVGDASHAIPWELNPLSSSSPIGFMPCSARCEPALQLARRTLDAVDVTARATIERTSRRAIVFFRHSAFFVLEGEPAHFTRAVLNGVGRATTIERWAHHLVGRALSAALRVELGDGALTIGDATIELVSPIVPRVLRFV